VLRSNETVERLGRRRPVIWKSRRARQARLANFFAEQGCRSPVLRKRLAAGGAKAARSWRCMHFKVRSPCSSRRASRADRRIRWPTGGSPRAFGSLRVHSAPSHSLRSWPRAPKHRLGVDFPGLGGRFRLGRSRGDPSGVWGGAMTWERAREEPRAH
jgi:hypothetical protein